MDDERPGSASWIMDGLDGQNQRWFVANSVLPVETWQDNAREVLEGLGVQFGEVHPENGLLVRVTLPQGWCVVADEQSPVALHLLDDRGRIVADIHYRNTTSPRAVLVLRPRA